ncbi:GTP-binding protein SAR1a, variant 2 [Balamuthia mandrillaris]
MEELPAELLARIFSFLDARTLLRVSCCCTRTHELAMSLSSLWKAFYAAEFGETPPSAAPPPQTNEPQQQDIKAASIARFQSQALALRQRWHLLAATLRQQQQNTPNEPAQQQRKGELEANEAAKGSWKVMKEKAVAASAWPPLRSKQDLWNKKKNGSQELHLLVLGLRGAGKSSMFHQLQKSYTCTTPCLDFSVQRASVSGLSFLSLDVDNAKLIPIWRHYYTAVCALIFVVDVSNRSCPSGLPRHSQLGFYALLSLFPLFLSLSLSLSLSLNDFQLLLVTCSLSLSLSLCFSFFFLLLLLSLSNGMKKNWQHNGCAWYYCKTLCSHRQCCSSLPTTR